MNGFLIIDKPGGITSRDAVNVVQRWLPKRHKIGHTGTLDPLATGVLVLCLGTATKLAERVQEMAKTYESRFRLGAVSDTDDADGTVTEREASPMALALIEDVLKSMTGTIMQMPPQFSALKVEGRRAYDAARKGETLELKPRAVRIDRIEVVRYDWPFLDLRIDCGKGTYIRSIARDLGAALGVGGMVQTLRRTRVGPFIVKNGISLPCEPEAGLAKLIDSGILTANVGIADATA